MDDQNSTKPQVDATAPLPSSAVNLDMPAQSSQPLNSAAPSADMATKPKKSAMPMVILLVVIVVLALAAAAYFAFIKKDSKTPATSTASTTQPSKTTTTSTTTTASTVTDPSTVSKNIDSSLSKIDESKDYNSTSLSDSTLGL